MNPIVTRRACHLFDGNAVRELELELVAPDADDLDVRQWDTAAADYLRAVTRVRGGLPPRAVRVVMRRAERDPVLPQCSAFCSREFVRFGVTAVTVL